MKLKIEVVPRNDINFVIESEEIEINDFHATIGDYLSQYGEYKELPLTFMLDGEIVSRETSLYGKRQLKIIVEPQGVFAFVFMLIVVVATFLYTMSQMNKLNANTGKNARDTQSSRSIYDVNAQGNKIKLGDVVPEQFGLFKKFPDYLADTHSYYKNNKYYLDLILCQGVGSFLHASNHDDIYIGNTSINTLSGIQCHVAEPGEDLSNNSIDPEITKCWFNSTEVTSSGHTLHALTTSVDNNVHLEYQSIFVEGYDLSKYRVGDMVKISGADNEWVVLPAFQNTDEHYPEQISGDWMVRCQKNYRNCFDHPHEFAVYPFRQLEMKASDESSPLPIYSFYTMYVNQRDFYADGTDAVFRLLDIPASELSIAESARRWGGEKWELNSAVFNQSQGAWYPSTELDNYLLLGNNARHVYKATGGWIPITSYYFYNYYINSQTSSGGETTYGTLDLQTIPDNSRIDCYNPMGMNTYDSVWPYIAYKGAYNALYQQTVTYAYRDTPLCYELKIKSNDGTYKLWNSRMKTNAMFNVKVGYCGRVKVVKCHRKDLEGKVIDVMASSLHSNSIPMQFAGVTTTEHSAYSTEWIRIGKLSFVLPTLGEHIMSAFEFEDFFGSLVPTKANGNWFSTIDYEYSPELIDSDWAFKVTDGDSIESPDTPIASHTFGHNCVAVRVTATPEGKWDFYDESRGTVDDNGYYKVVAVYGENNFSADLDSPILVNSKNDLSNNNAKRLFTTPHQNHRVYNRDIMLASKDYKGREFTSVDQYFRQVKIGNKWEDTPCYAPSVTKVMLHRCDSAGNLYNDWTGFWAVDSIQKNAVVENLTQGLSTKDINNSMCGPYRAAPIGVEVSEIELDFTAPGGIYYMNDTGEIEPYHVDIRIEYQRKGDVTWQHRDITLTSEGVKKFSNGEYTSTGMDAVGVTEKFDLPQGDWIFRCYKLTPEHTDEKTHYYEEVRWTGLKSVIANPQSYDNMTVLLMRFEGNETLSEMNQNQISTLFTRKLPMLSDATTLEPTTNLAPAINYVCQNSKFANLLNIGNLSDLDAIWKVRGLRCNGSLDTDNTLLQVLSDMLHIGYSELCTRADHLEIVQITEKQTDTSGQVFSQSNIHSITDFDFLFTPQNYSNLSVMVALPKLDDIDEVVVTYTDVNTYKTKTVYVHLNTTITNNAPDTNYNKIVVTDYSTSKHSESLQTFGVTDRAQAVAMGARRLRSIKRQRIQITIDTEFDALNCNYKDFVGIALEGSYASLFAKEMSQYYAATTQNNLKYTDKVSGYGISDPNSIYNYTARITAVDSDMKTLTLNPPINTSVNRNYSNLFITDQEGKPHLCAIDRWLSSSRVRLSYVLPFEYDADVEQPRVSFGFIVPCWVESIKPTEKKCTVTLVNYDHTVFVDDLPMREGYGVSLYGGSPYGKSY